MVLAELPPTLLTIVAGVLGLLFGSFSNVVIYRLPRGESIAFPPSHCPACSAPIRPYDNVPLLGFLLLRGRARCCKAKIPWRYPVVELLGGLWSVAAMRVLVLDLPGQTPWWEAALLFVAYLSFGLLLIDALFIDLDHMILPDPITLGGAALGLVTSGWLREISVVDAAIGAAVGYGGVRLVFVELYRRIRGQPGMGLGDAKLLLMTGAWFGVTGVLFALVLGAVLGTLVALVALVTRGEISEPEGVLQERREVEELLATLQGEERAELEAELARDPLFAQGPGGIGGARLAFGPFLAITTLAFPLIGEALVARYLEMLAL